MTDAIARLRAGIPAELTDDLERVLAELARVTAESDARWEAIGRLAPRAKEHRGRREDLERALDAIRERLAGPLDDDARTALVALVTRALAR